MLLPHQTYSKINTLYKRYLDGKNKGKIILGEYSDKVTEYLANVKWLWYEKIDGTNFAVYWDGHTKEYHGKSEKACIKKEWCDKLNTIFTEEALSRVFTPRKDDSGNEIPMLVKIYGELHGKGIQGGMGKAYADFAHEDYLFRIFDINIDGWWLEMDKVEDIARALNVEVVPFVGEMTIKEAENLVINGFKSAVGDCAAEGLVGRVKYGLTARNGGRVMVKIKTCDYRDLGIKDVETEEPKKGETSSLLDMLKDLSVKWKNPFKFHA